MKLVEPVGVAAAQVWLPEGRSLAADAIRGGRLRTRHAADLGLAELPCAVDDSAPDMAVHAARAALKEAGVDARSLDVLCHAWMYYQGHDLWSPPHYVAHQIGADAAFPVGVQQVCNGGAAGLELTAARLAATAPRTDGGPRWGLVTTADRFVEPGFDRWAGDYGVAYGDGATAVLLRTPGGPDDVLSLRAVAGAAAVDLEAMHRGTDPFADAARTHRDRVDMRATKQAYLREYGRERFERTNERMIRAVTAEALADACLDPWDPRLRWAVLPRFGARTLREHWIPVLADCTGAEPLDYGRATGHLGTGDALAGLADLVARGALAPGEAALVFSAGAGFTWSCLVVQAPRR